MLCGVVSLCVHVYFDAILKFYHFFEIVDVYVVSSPQRRRDDCVLRAVGAGAVGGGHPIGLLLSYSYWFWTCEEPDLACPN